MKAEAQISMHLLMASTLSILSMLLGVIILVRPWEMWMIPLMIISCLVVWWLHIGRIGSEILYENICSGLLIIELFFLGVHESSLFDIPLATCAALLFLSLLNRKRLLYLAAFMYVLQILYHFLVLDTINAAMNEEDLLRLILGAATVLGSLMVTRYRINRRQGEREKYESMQEQLAIAVRQNAEFLSNVSHELRTPVNMVIGISEVALGKELPSEIREDIYSIKMAGKRLSGLISNILDYTESVEGTLIAVQESYTITSVINDVITIISMQSGSSKLEVVFDIDPRIPSVLIGDAEKITHILKILLENSLKFTEEGGICLCVGFRRESYGINLIIDIYDTGIGMAPSQLGQIKDDFYQADSGSQRYVGGLGLGIPIARGLLHSMGGFVHFDSKEQEGLQVHIAIPQGVEDDTPSIVVPNASKMCIACYFRPDKYDRDEVREYYDNMILHLVEGLGVEGYQAHNFEGLLKLQREHRLTHIFVAQLEYMGNAPYYEELAESIQVAVIADKGFVLDEGSKLLVLRKPFFALSIVNLLSGQKRDNKIEDVHTIGRRPFTCPGVRALAVDDEEMNLVVVKGVLGSYGIQVDICGNGRTAVERCTQNDYDIIFLDHMMPGFDGVETLRRIREVNDGMFRNLPVIALTANTLSGAREMFRNEGFSEFIPKPIERVVLERVLRRVLPESCIRYDTDLAGIGSEDQKKEAVSETKEQADNKNTDSGVPLQEEPSGADAAAENNVPAYEPLVTAGINVSMGLEYCNDEEAFYREMLQMFHDQADGKRNEIVSLYERADWADYAIKVHALKSTSLTIGAEELSGQAKELERAGKEQDVEYIRENHPLLLQLYRQVCESIEKYLS